jgi:hypothetical protein
VSPRKRQAEIVRDTARRTRGRSTDDAKAGGSKSASSKAPPASKAVRFDQAKEIRAIARERVGTVKAARPMEPKQRRKPKHPKRLEELDQA